MALFEAKGKGPKKTGKGQQRVEGKTSHGKKNTTGGGGGGRCQEKKRGGFRRKGGMGRSKGGKGL